MDINQRVIGPVTGRIAELARPTGEEDLLNVNYPTPRFEITIEQAIIVALVVLVGLAGWFVVKPTPEPAAASWAGGVEAGVESGSSSEWAGRAPGANLGVGSAGAGAGEQSQEVVVSVLGAVDNPGLVTLEEGARVADALEAAGAKPEADMMSLNLAQRLTDGQQIVVTRVGDTPPPDAPSVGGQAVSINNASATELMELPGVGEATAAAIVAHREDVGGFSDIAQLQDVSGIGPAKFAKLEGLVVL